VRTGALLPKCCCNDAGFSRVKLGSLSLFAHFLSRSLSLTFSPSPSLYLYLLFSSVGISPETATVLTEAPPPAVGNWGALNWGILNSGTLNCIVTADLSERVLCSARITGAIRPKLAPLKKASATVAHRHTATVRIPTLRHGG